MAPAKRIAHDDTVRVCMYTFTRLKLPQTETSGGGLLRRGGIGKLRTTWTTYLTYLTKGTLGTLGRTMNSFFIKHVKYQDEGKEGQNAD